MVEEAAKDVGKDDEEVGGQRVALPKPITTGDPIPRGTVEKDSSFTKVQKRADPRAPVVREASMAQDTKKTLPVHAIKCLVKIELKDERWGVSAIAAVEEISSVSKALGDTMPKDEAGLIITDKLRDEGL
jgi:hypothetical protein